MSTTISNGFDRAVRHRSPRPLPLPRPSLRAPCAPKHGQRKESAAVCAPADKKAPRRDPLTRLRQQLEQVEARIAALAASAHCSKQSLPPILSSTD